jgi:hypothetical protein
MKITAKVKEGKAFPIHAIKANRGSKRITPFILKLHTRWR